MIGLALAQARGLLTKHGIKQVNRLLSNQGGRPWQLFAQWVPEVVGDRTSIVVAMDWTDSDADGPATLVLSLITSHDRAMPLLWLSMLKNELKARRNDIEDACLAHLREVLAIGTKVTVLADRSSGNHKLFAFLTDLDFDYVIRFSGNIHFTAADWVHRYLDTPTGRRRRLRPRQVHVRRSFVNRGRLLTHGMLSEESLGGFTVATRSGGGSHNRISTN